MRILGKAFGVVSLLFALFALGFSWRDLQHLKAPSMEAVSQLVGMSPAVAPKSATEVFKESFDNIRSQYYRPVDSKDLKYAGLQGMMASLGDPHTIFLPPRAAANFRLETGGSFAGVGARLSPDPLGARIVSVFEDGPAQKAGVRKEDLITSVNGKPVGGIHIDDIVKEIRGPAGSSVTLGIVRQGSAKPITVRIRRAQVTTPTTESKMLPGTKIGYLSMSIFSEPTSAQYDSAVGKLEKAGMKGLIVDVRDNPGGLLDTAVEILSRYVEDRLVVKMKGREGEEEVAKTMSGFRRPVRYPIVILINEDSASAAEIFSGVMRDYRLATLVGDHTYGKASVQNVIQLIDGASAKVTIAKYFLPSGQDISRKVDDAGTYVSGGIQPDVKVGWDPSAIGTMGDPKTDPQLKKAIEVLKAKLGPSVMAPVPEKGLAAGMDYWVFES